MRTGRSATSEPLRLVRVRLTLVILATAVLPLALALVVLPALDSADRNGEQARVGAASTSLAAAVGSELERARGALLMASANAAVAEALRPGAVAAWTDPRLAAMAAVAGASVERIAVLGVDGTERIGVA